MYRHLYGFAALVDTERVNPVGLIGIDELSWGFAMHDLVILVLVDVIFRVCRSSCVHFALAYTPPPGLVAYRSRVAVRA